MGILVDGYNLLFTYGLPRKSPAESMLEEARGSLLDLLADCLGDVACDVTVVFDAKQAPTGRDNEYSHRGIHVIFARQQADADELLEALIARDPHPGQLLVVSSDRRVQTAAARRKATFVESEQWLEEIRRPWEPASESETKTDPDARQRRPNAEEIEGWLRAFEAPKTPDRELGHERSQGGRDDSEEQAWHPFPPGYGEDVS